MSSCQSPEKFDEPAFANQSITESCLDGRLTKWFWDFNLYQEEGHTMIDADKLAWEDSETYFQDCLNDNKIPGPTAHSRVEKKEKY